MFKILAVIPARGGSKGIPRKNIRFMCGKPLIAYAIQTALDCADITHCVVSTEDVEIADVVKHYGCEVVQRGEELSRDDVPLDPVVYDAVLQMEKRHHCKYDCVITMQPTSPLLQKSTLDSALAEFFSSRFDTMISAVNRPHLSWKVHGGLFLPNYKERLNRQFLPADYMETGAFVITKRKYVTPRSRFGKKVTLYETSSREAIDIDTAEDWIIAESLLRKKRIVFRADGMKQLGMGHIYNCITMAFSMIEHEVLFVTRADYPEGLEKIKQTHLPYRVISSEADLENVIDEFQPDIWVNDCLNTSASYIKRLKKSVQRVVTIEDLGPGTQYADAVINALYEQQDLRCKALYRGMKYICLRGEFMMEHPKEFSEEVKNVIVLFGGTDPANLNKKLYAAAKSLSKDHSGISFHFITGIGYDANANGVLSLPERRIFVYNNVPKVTEYMKRADLAVTSQGRTVYEIASMGVPALVLAQNSRELTHTFATMKNGFLNLGLGQKMNVDAIINTMNWIINTPSIRSNMRSLMMKHDFRGNMKRIKEIITGDERDD